MLGRPGDTDMAGQVLVALGTCLALAVLQSVAATTYTVGGSTGWTIPTSITNLYSDWVKDTTFKLGDILVFKFATNVHDVYRVSKADYDKCVSTSALEKYQTGPATITLNSTGHHYYICAVTGHCSAGQKVSIKVSTAAAPGSSPSQAPASSPATTVSSPAPGSRTPSATTPTSANAPGTSASKSDASHSASSSAAAIFMAILFGFATLFL